ncbi:ATP-dependent helicase/nuclease subunit A [Leuconostoc litchii]|uniref:ATP-dependent helicase/nuclease subunit A n=1 Tax=Leuconostoc litchii TaxID=1981069 RepID=A0A6P2CKN3_9LACO|nr:helicase-exonuclease AddAB subunit AddA [Leuconostoc litchii]TYC46608.1 helicase-exonuclease AddAB subunit AddA [Leuconostoc litchii]GMA70466.1 ATP-dependent helicase/nuclease subunit A [Leuconostoc litchii]
MATKFTDNQQRAIKEKDHNILVAASAGSGKTTVLIERLIQKILNGTSVERFLIVTFTNAAAKEMRERLEVAIEKRLQVADEQQKRFLQEQLLILPAANISTIDAYALRIIEMYYHIIGLDPQFRLLSDTAERSLLQQDVLTKVLADFYEENHEQHQSFLSLVNNFGNPNQDEPLQKIILKLSDFAEARADGEEWLKNLLVPYEVTDQPLVKTTLYKHSIRPIILETINDLIDKAQVVLMDIAGVDELKKTQDGFSEIIDYLLAINKKTMTSSWDELRSAILDMPAGKINTQTSKIKENPEISALLESARQIKGQIIGAKSQINDLKTSFFSLDEKSWQQVQKASYQLINTLIVVTETFRKAFKQAKREDNLLDFPDLGTLALEILADENTKKTIQGQFDEILVDEYQDINQLQETLLTSVSNGHNMYMVGDVKQSIYGFRQAEPSLFTNKYKRFSQAKNDDIRIDLADNFRSQNNVTNVTNLIFTQIMDESLGDIAYTGEAKLVPKASYPDEVPAVFDLDIIVDDGEDSNENDAETFEKRQAQYALLAEKIRHLRETTIYDRKADPARMRPVQYSDIAILTRAKSGYIDLVSTLRAAGIPVQIDGVGNYFQTMEVYLMLDILRVIDNPHQDIPLAAVLRSPIFNFDENELAEIRIADNVHDYWTALKSYAKDSKKAQHFLDLIDKWHTLATQNDLVSLIWSIYDDTAWLDYVAGMPGGRQRQANLHALYEYARSYQNNTHSGLFRFVRYIEQLQVGDSDLGEAAQETDTQAVRIMTIHASKGLEFPIVLLPEFDKAFNKQDLNGGLLIQKNEGVGLEYVQPDALVTIPTLQKMVVKQALKRQSWSEEMRLLYVALTRAEQQLFIIGSVKVTTEKDNQALKMLWQQAKNVNGQFLPEFLRLQADSYLKWLLMSLARSKNSVLEEWLGDGQLPRLLGPETSLTGKINVHIKEQSAIHAPTVTAINEDKNTTENYSQQDFNHAKRILNYQYPNIAATQTAAYQSVSEIKRLFEDPDQSQMENAVISEDGQLRPANVLMSDELLSPTFMSDGSQKPSKSAVGTATHLILQLIDFTKINTLQKIETLRDQLVEKHRILDNVAAMIDIDGIITFLQSDFAQQIIAHHETLNREATFAMIMPANEIYQSLDDKAPVLIHGIIDGYFVDEFSKTITLFDYKTDFVRHNRIEEDLDKLRARYKGQLLLYKRALQQEFSDYIINEPQLISLSSGRVINIK